MEFTPLGIGPDVSFYQDDDRTVNKIDFVKMKQAGAQGVIARAGQNFWPDEDFRDYWREAKLAGLPRGSYWFFDSRNSPQNQANIWKNQIGSDYPELGLWLDLEESYDGPYKGERHWKQMMYDVRRLFPLSVELGIYTANWWWSSQGAVDNNYWAVFPLWVAEYGESASNVILPLPWRLANKRAVLWQYTAKGDGRKYGVESLNIDLNYMSQDFYDLFSMTPTTPEPEPGDTMITYLLTVITAGLNGRSSPNGTINFPSGAGLTTGFKYGDSLMSDEVQDNWYHITSCRRNGMLIDIPDEVWAYAGSTNGYLRLDETQSQQPTGLPSVLYIATQADMSDKTEYRKV